MAKAADKTKDKVCRTAHQYNKGKINNEDMDKLMLIAKRFGNVKNYVYQRYGGIHSLSKITPGYVVQKELIAEGYREKSGLPSVYFQNALFDALEDIRSAWSKRKSRLQKAIYDNENFSDLDRHYLRYLLKVDNAFSAVLESRPVELPDKMMRSYTEASQEVDTERLNNYLRRQIRKHHNILHTDVNDFFSVDYRGYRYADHGIYFASTEKMKRIFVPLTDTVETNRQICVKLNSKENSLEILVPINVSKRKHENYVHEVGIALGIHTMVTTDNGNSYGTDFGKMHEDYATWLREENRKLSLLKEPNNGRKKYDARKNRMQENIKSYVNHEINRFLETEKPCVVYIPKLSAYKKQSYNKTMNYKLTTWQKGIITDNLVRKCQNNSVEVVWVKEKGMGRTCSACGTEWNKVADARLKDEKGHWTGMVRCPLCGTKIDEMNNAAINVKIRGQRT
jgi:hypothetical protein